MKLFNKSGVDVKYCQERITFELHSTNT